MSILLDMIAHESVTLIRLQRVAILRWRMMFAVLS
jgi:hypothetical protein